MAAGGVVHKWGKGKTVQGGAGSGETSDSTGVTDASLVALSHLLNENTR